LTTILAVDDSNTMRRVLEITFAGEDFNVILAGGADQALGELRKARPPIALVDVTLGSSNGYDLCQQIKAELPATRVLLLSSKQHPYDNGRGAAAGADDHLDKPFDTQALIEKVKALAAAPARAFEQPAPSRTLGAPPPKPVEAPTFVPGGRADAPRVGAIAAAPPMRMGAAGAVDPRTQPPASAAGLREMNDKTDVGASPQVAASLEHKLGNLGLTRDQVLGVLALSKEIIEQAVWEVVPNLAETLIKEEIQRLTR
jgi:CheY-like chemotaxis protein